MFLSPLNWHYAKFSSFAWKDARATDVPTPEPAPAEQRPERSAPAARGYESRSPDVIEKR